MSTTASAQRLHDASPVLVLFVVLTITAIVGQTWWAIVQDRRLTLASEKENGLIAVRLLEEHATQTLQDAERKLDNVALAIAARGKVRTLDGPEVLKVITKGLHDNRFLTALQFTNLQGESWVSSLDYPAFQFDAQDRTYIPWLLKHPEFKQALVGHPLKRFYDQQLVLPLARNLYDQNQNHLGLISTDISVSYFSSVYARVAQNSQAVVAVFADEGFVIVHSPFDMRFFDMNISASPILKTLRQGAEEGSFEDSSFLDNKSGKQRLFTYRKIRGYPVTTVFGRDVDSILQAWQKRTRDRIFFSSATVGLICLLTFFLLQHIRRLRRSEISLRNSETKFVSLFQRSPVPLALLDLRTDTYIEVNDALQQQFGGTREEIIGKSTGQLHTWEQESERQRYLELLLKHGYVERLEAHLRRKDGQVYICQLSSRLLQSEGTQMVLFSPIDVTRQRQIELEIRQLNTQLEQRVRQRTQNLEKANQELAQALTSLQTMQSELLRSEKMAALGSLVAGVAHELNTPIGNSVTVASTLQESTSFMLAEVRGGKPRRSMLDKHLESSSKGMEILERNLHKAAELVSSFKQVAVDQSSNHRRNFDLRHALEEVAVTLEPLYKKTRYVLHQELAPDIDMDSYPGPLGQIITNFLTNALAHAFEGREEGNMWLSTRLLPGGQVEIVFRDDGVGISEQYRERVFDPFFTTKLGQGGSGLGMHIVYNLVTGVLGGKISLHSTPGQGTSLIMILPLVAPETCDLTETASAFALASRKLDESDSFTTAAATNLINHNAPAIPEQDSPGQPS